MAETPGSRKLGDKRRYFLLLIPPLLIAVALSSVLVLFSRPNSEHELDGDLCALAPEQPAERAVFLLDLRKPVDEANLSLPGELLREVSQGLGANTELRVFALSSDPRAPRLPLDRFCKPYANADLQMATAKDQTNTLRDCDDLPAQLPASLRETAARFCDRRDTLHQRVDVLARNQPAAQIANSYLIEALEDTVFELSEGSGPKTIYVFSDMMQHAAWYSHLDLEWTEWDFARFGEARAAQMSRMGRSPSLSDLAVRVYYLPRVDRTDHPRPKRAHQAFWEAYFTDAQLTFEEQPVLPAYAAESLMDRLTPEELAALEREQIEQERAEAQQMLAEAQRERESLEEELRKLAEERARMDAASRAQPEPQPEPEAEPEAERQQQQPVDQTEPLDTPAAQASEIAQTAQDEPVPPPETPADPSSPPELAADPSPPPEVAEQTAAAEADDPPETRFERRIRAGERSDPAAERRLPPCEAALLPRFLAESATDMYPGRRRMNYGSAIITIRYALDETGHTINDQIAVIPEESSAQRPRSLDLFSDTAVDAVRTWVFEFGDADEGTCSKRQERTIQFEFHYN